LSKNFQSTKFENKFSRLKEESSPEKRMNRCCVFSPKYRAQ
jgi:hypothetical protein